jgi:hypothetical protein
MQFVYTDPKAPELAQVVREGDCMVIPAGYHPNVAAPGGSINFAGLFTVELPPGIHAGQEFRVKVRRIATRRQAVEQIRTAVAPQINAFFAEARGETGRKGQLTINWRYVIGTFGVTIPVVSDRTLLFEDENAYAILSWRLSQFSAAYRWRPVVERYLEYLARRIDAAGGDAGSIRPSQWGYRPHRMPGGGESDGREGDTHGSIYEQGLERTVAWYRKNEAWWRPQMWMRHIPIISLSGKRELH